MIYLRLEKLQFNLKQNEFQKSTFSVSRFRSAVRDFM